MIGNPPYKEKAKGGAAGSRRQRRHVWRRSTHWMPPAEWGVGAHAKHLRNLYVYFWRWATWKVFGHGRGAIRRSAMARAASSASSPSPGSSTGPGFQRMRDYLRQDGRRHLGDRLLARRAPARDWNAHLPGRAAAGVHRAHGPDGKARRGEARAGAIRSLPAGDREGKFAALAAPYADGAGWTDSARMAGSVSAGCNRRMGNVPGAGRAVRL